MLSEMRYRKRAWHSCVVEDQDGRMVAIAETPAIAHTLAATPDLQRALQVMILTPGIRAHLEATDPKALEQAERAIAKAEGRA
jgi:orotidine-5'-phosphate decarboxylase